MLSIAEPTCVVTRIDANNHQPKAIGVWSIGNTDEPTPARAHTLVRMLGDQCPALRVDISPHARLLCLQPEAAVALPDGAASTPVGSM